MSLKYYRDEANRYGSMGALTAATMEIAMEKACAHFGVPRVSLKFAGTARRFSWYRAGLQMATPLGRLAGAMEIPTIKMAPNHMIWQVFCHEFAHHVHFARYNAKVVEKAEKDGIDYKTTTREARTAYWKWFRANFKREHAHGPAHRSIMQEVVDYFMSIGMITEKPKYMQTATMPLAA